VQVEVEPDSRFVFAESRVELEGRHRPDLPPDEANGPSEMSPTAVQSL